MDQQTFDKKLANKFPNEKYVVLHYGENSAAETVIKCLECGRRIIVNTGELFRTRRKHICSRCHYKRKDTLKNEETITKRLLEANHFDIEFYMERRGGIRHNMVRHRCGKCGRINNHEVANLLRNKTVCGFCESGITKDHDFYVSQLTEKFGHKFTLLTEYVNAKTNIKVRCERCGFIRALKPNTLIESGYCPKCDDKSSKGEKVISAFLSKHQIAFETQKYFSDWNIGIHYFDFYIPKYNLVLEYQGIQHFQFNEFFHKTLEEFEQRQTKDRIKKEAAIKQGFNYVSIGYQSFNDLDSILNIIFNSTTILEGSRGKLLEIETIQDIG